MDPRFITPSPRSASPVTDTPSTGNLPRRRLGSASRSRRERRRLEFARNEQSPLVELQNRRRRKEEDRRQLDERPTQGRVDVPNLLPPRRTSSQRPRNSQQQGLGQAQQGPLVGFPREFLEALAAMGQDDVVGGPQQDFNLPGQMPADVLQQHAQGPAMTQPGPDGNAPQYTDSFESIPFDSPRGQNPAENLQSPQDPNPFQPGPVGDEPPYNNLQSEILDRLREQNLVGNMQPGPNNNIPEPYMQPRQFSEMEGQFLEDMQDEEAGPSSDERSGWDMDAPRHIPRDFLVRSHRRGAAPGPPSNQARPGQARHMPRVTEIQRQILEALVRNKRRKTAYKRSRDSRGRVAQPRQQGSALQQSGDQAPRGQLGANQIQPSPGGKVHPSPAAAAKMKFSASNEVEASIAAKQSDKDLHLLEKESRFLAMCRDAGAEHVVGLIKEYYEYAQWNGEIVGRIYMEFCEGGELLNLLLDLDDLWPPPESVPEFGIWKMFECLARGICALDDGQEELAKPPRFLPHMSPIVHCDLKPQNILVGTCDNERHDMVPIIKVADLGLALQKRLEDQEDMERQLFFRGTPGWLAPEQTGDINVQYGSFTNVFAIGHIMYWIITRGEDEDGFHLTASRNLPDIFDGRRVATFGANIGKYINGDDYSQKLLNTIFHCICKQRDDRPKPHDLLRTILQVLEVWESSGL
ncbi:hypothetical protein PVAG01_04237 [Phlyctema vagabunda]|uniref:non-specific serine/threonine protein kinase n=1 Tax=Phlyctema vagabunda TaxID=108571 RepID=A0ABR4PPZ3_9HELO